MNSNGVSPTEGLLKRFAEAARRVGLGRSCGNPDSLVDAERLSKDDRKRAFAEAQTIASVLRAKATKGEIEPLFDAADADVSLCATLVLGDLAPELAEATPIAVIAGLSTQDVLTRARRARASPAPRPTLQEMSDDALLARFEDAGERLGGCRFLDTIENPEEFRVRDRIIEELGAIRAEVERRGMLARLEPFLDSQDAQIRLQAALGCLRVAPAKAVATLQALAEKADPDTQISADWALQRWRSDDRD